MTGDRHRSLDDLSSKPARGGAAMRRLVRQGITPSSGPMRPFVEIACAHCRVPEVDLWTFDQFAPARYRSKICSSYNDALCKRGSMLIWVDQEMAWPVPPEGRPGRPPVFSDAAIQFCLSIKVQFNLVDIDAPSV